MQGRRLFLMHPTSGPPLQVKTQRRSATESQKLGKEKIDSSSHKIWGIQRTGHNAHYLGKPLLGLSVLAIFNETSRSSTELPTEAVEQKLFLSECGVFQDPKMKL